MDWLIGKRRGRAEKDAAPQETTEQTASANGQNSNVQSNNSQDSSGIPPSNELLNDDMFPYLVKVPSGLDEREWLATNTIPFFNNIIVLHSAVSEFCTSSSCPIMCVAPNWPLYWIDDKGKKKKCTASKYGDLALSFIQKQINDESLFPTKRGIPFPAHFESVLRRVYRFLFQILAHAYTVHLRQLSVAHLGPQVTCVFKHLIMFSLEYHLLDVKEMDPVSDLVRRLSVLSGCSTPSYQPLTNSNGNNNGNGNGNGNSLDTRENSGNSAIAVSSSSNIASNNSTTLLSTSAVGGSSSASPAASLTHLQLQPVA